MTTGTVRVVARPEVAAGFALAGLPVTELAPDREAGPRIAALARDARTALLLVEETLLRLLPDEDRAALAKRAVPIVVPFPAPAWDEARVEPADYILGLLQRAIGYRVRLQ